MAYEWQAGTLPPIEDQPPVTPDVTKDKKKPQGRPASTGTVATAPVPPPGWEAESKRQVQEQLGSGLTDFEAMFLPSSLSLCSRMFPLF